MQALSASGGGRGDERDNMNATAISIVAAGALVAGALLYTSGTFDRFLAPPFEQALRDHFVDPESVQIRGAFEDGVRWCGEVNAKNRMGGYVGWSRFIALDQSLTSGGWRIMVESDPAWSSDSSAMNTFNGIYCSR